MDNATIKTMILALIKEIDYDIWKEFGGPQESQFIDKKINKLVKIVKYYSENV